MRGRAVRAASLVCRSGAGVGSRMGLQPEGGIEYVAYQKALIQQLAAQTSLNVLGIKPISDKVSRFAP